MMHSMNEGVDGAVPRTINFGRRVGDSELTMLAKSGLPGALNGSSDALLGCVHQDARRLEPVTEQTGRTDLTSHSTRPRVTLVVPALNEAQNIPWVFERIPDRVDEIILVDGYSRDNTVEAALRVRPETRVVRQHARGKGSALRAGFAAATGDYVVMIDADCSMNPGEIQLFVSALDSGYDFVKGSRFLPGGGSEDLTILRNVGNYALKASVNILFLVPFTDLCYGYVAFRRSCLNMLGLSSHGFEIETEMAIRAVKAGLKIAEVPSMEFIRAHGISNLNTFRDGKRVLRTLVRERISRRQRPIVDWLQFPNIEATLAAVTAQELERGATIKGTLAASEAAS